MSITEENFHTIRQCYGLTSKNKRCNKTQQNGKVFFLCEKHCYTDTWVKHRLNEQIVDIILHCQGRVKNRRCYNHYEYDNDDNDDDGIVGDYLCDKVEDEGRLNDAYGLKYFCKLHGPHGSLYWGNNNEINPYYEIHNEIKKIYRRKLLIELTTLPYDCINSIMTYDF
jgi:hypothetical protein